MRKMKAFVKVRPESGGAEYSEFDVPWIGPDEVLIEIKAAGICGTDMHLYDWADNIVREYKPELPLVMGHEFAGIITELGLQVDGLKKGDKVTAFPILYCGKCRYCRNGEPNICNDRPLLGLGANGVFAQFVAVRAKNVYKLDDRIPFEIGALSEITCVGLHAIDRIRMGFGDTVAVVGCGPLGIIMAILAKHSGAAHVFITGLEQDRQRLELARKIGATPVSVDQEDPKQLILDSTDGMGADIVFETAGSPSGVIQSMDIARKGGRVSILGQGHAATEILTATLSFREIELVGTRAYTGRDWDKISSVLLNTADDLRHIITHRLPLERAAQGFQMMKALEGLKIILEP
jgi:(R,R)-butanediol dehydrogenase / meso-butanediol dehydrogenase / diacetyl reductase